MAKRVASSAVVVLLLLGIVLPALPGVAAAETRTPYGQVLSWGDEVSFQTTIGPNQPITTGLGVMTYQSFCFLGTQDFIYPSTDVYIVPTGTVHLEDKLSDAGGAPHTVNAEDSGGVFTDESLGYTAPDGKIKPGVYDVVYDECQDGKFGLDDALFEKALTVTKATVPPPPIPNLALMKFAADKLAKALKKGSARVEAALKAAAAVDLDPVNRGIGALDPRIPFIADPRKVVVILLANQVKHYEGIAADPPDPAFAQPDVLRGAEVADPASNAAFDVLLARFGTAESTQGELAEAFLRGIERYQGAAQAGDGAWALSHARSVRDAANALAAQSDASTAVVDALRASAPAAGLPTDAQVADLQAFYDRVRTSGFTADEAGRLRALGLDDAAIARLRDGLATADTSGATVADVQAGLDDVRTAQADLVSAARGMATSMGEVVSTLEADVLPAPPDASGGGPYAGPEGSSLVLHGSTTATGADLRWDTDGDGVYDDATGLTPTITLGSARDGLVSLLATDASGHAGVTYVPLTVAEADRRPELDGSTPPGPEVALVAGSTQPFTVTAHDPEGRPVSTSWSLDGSPVATGSSFSYSPGSADVGRHHLEAVTTDGSPLGGDVRRLWNVTVGRASLPAAPPSLVPLVAPGPGPAGWNTTDVTVSWSVYDPSSPSAPPGCAPTTVRTETPGTIVTCSATGGSGLTATSTVTVKLDKTPPTTTATAAPPVSRAVTVSLSAGDGRGSGVTGIRYVLHGAQTGSGAIDGTTGTVSITGQGTTYITYAARDVAGNWESPKVLPVVNEVGVGDYVVDPHFALSVFASGFAGRPCCGSAVGPVGLAFDSSSNLLVGDFADGTVYRFGAAGGVAGPATQASPPIPGDLAGIAFSKTGRMYAARQAYGDVVEVDRSSGAVLRSVSSPGGAPTGLAVDPLSGDLFVSLPGAATVQRIAGFETGPQTVTTYFGGRVIDGLSFGPDGSLYAADSSTQHLIRLAGTDTPAPGAVTDIAPVPTLDGVAVAASPDPAAPPYVFANRNDGRITKVDLSTSPPTLTDIVSNGTRGDFVTVGPDGCLYATQAATVLKVTNADGSCSLAPLGAAPQLRLSPPVAAHDIGSQHAVTARFSNASVPAGTPVAITVTGANPRTATVTTDVTGEATFSYRGAAEGIDEVTAAGDAGGQHLTSNTTKVTWVAPPADTIPPSTTATPSPAASSSSWSNRDVTVGLAAVDNPGGSGVQQVSMSLAGAQTGEATTPGAAASATISAEGLTTLTYGATDRAGNVEAPNRLDVRVDKTAPETTGSSSPAPPFPGWHAGDVLVRLSATDGVGSGVTGISYSLSGAQTGEGTGTSTATPTISAEGTTTVSYTATDRAGNISAPKTLTVRIDRSPSTTDASLSPAPNAAGWNAADPTVTFTARDAGVGVQKITYELEGPERRRGTLAGGAGSITLTADGVTTVTYFATDELGHQEAPKKMVVRLDKAPPKVFAVPSTRAAAGGAYDGPASVALRATDLGGSGTRRLTYSLAGATTGTGGVDGDRAQLSISAVGTTTITFSARDVAGNEGPAQTFAVKIGSPPQPPPDLPYAMVAKDGGVFAPGGQGFVGTAAVRPGDGILRDGQGRIIGASGSRLDAPVVAIAYTPSRKGSWLVQADGGVIANGDAPAVGDVKSLRLASPIVGAAATRDGAGLYLVAGDGGIFALGRAPFHGSLGAQRLNQPIVGMGLDGDGSGYLLVAADGGVFTFDAQFRGSLGARRLNKPIVGIAVAADGGYVLAASDGGAFTYGTPFAGSLGDVRLAAPVVGIAADPDGTGYWMAAADGGVFAFGARFSGSVAPILLNAPISGIAAL